MDHRDRLSFPPGQIRQGAVTTAVVVALCATPARANAGFPMIGVIWPWSWVLFLPVALVEAIAAVRVLRQCFRDALVMSFIANAVSTFVGIPVTWLLLAIIETSSPAMDWGLLTRWQRLAEVTVRSPWFGGIDEPVQMRWMVPTACVVLCLPFFFASVLIESMVARRYVAADRRRLARRWAWMGNGLSYGLILLCLGFRALMASRGLR